MGQEQTKGSGTNEAGVAGAKRRVGGEREVAPAPRAVLSPCVPDVRASVSNASYVLFGYSEWLPLTLNTETATATGPPSPLGPATPSVVPARLTGPPGDSGSERRTQARSGLQNQGPCFPKTTEGPVCTSKFEKGSYKKSPAVTTPDTQAVLGQRTPWKETLLVPRQWFSVGSDCAVCHKRRQGLLLASREGGPRGAAAPHTVCGSAPTAHRRECPQSRCLRHAVLQAPLPPTWHSGKSGPVKGTGQAIS